MARFFHVDRTGTLTPGQVLTLTRYRDVDPPELQGHVDSFLPDGVARHGELYLLQGGAGLQLLNPTLELVWEYARRAVRPDAPSRYQSVFAWESLNAARQFQQTHPPAGAVWEVEAPAGFRADMNLLSGNSALVASFFAHLYWQGATHPTAEPTWEVLLTPPVVVVALAGSQD